MKVYLHLLLFLFLSWGFSHFSYSQIELENKQSAEFYIRNVFLGPGVEVGNINFIGKADAFGQFKADSSIIGVKSGIILSTGNSDSINGPNNNSGYTSLALFAGGRKEMRRFRRGDRDLNRISKRRANDICLIEFDFVPIKNKLEFNYVFASEEYPEFVGSNFNDTFAFFMSGPNIRRRKNIALLPDQKTPISINTINHKTNRKFYRKNILYREGNRQKIRDWYYSKLVSEEKRKYKYNPKLFHQIQFDGLTTVLKIEQDVIPFKKYHIKMVIGDVSDFAFDSAVLLEAGSFISIEDKNGEFYDSLLLNEGNKLNIDSILGINQTTEELNISKVEMEDEQFELTDIYFDVDSYDIPDSSKEQLIKLVNYLQSHPNRLCSIFGYTDNAGSKKYNQKLSEKRAKTVMNFLSMRGIEEGRLSYRGFNFSNPKYRNDSEEGKLKNRRVEILLE